MLFERTPSSRNPDALIKQELEKLRSDDQMSPDLVFRDPYLLDFLGLADTFSEKDLEGAILHELEHFLLEPGSDFSFVARQKRMSIGKKDFYLDLLFYHRALRRLVAVEPKLGAFDAAYKGQVGPDPVQLEGLRTNRAVGIEPRRDSSGRVSNPAA